MTRKDGMIKTTCANADDVDGCVDDRMSLFYSILMGAESISSISSSYLLSIYGNRATGLLGYGLYNIGFLSLAFCALYHPDTHWPMAIVFIIIGIASSSINFSLLDTANRVEPQFRLIAITLILSSSYIGPLFMAVPTNIMTYCDVSLWSIMMILYGTMIAPLTLAYIVCFDKRVCDSNDYSIVLGGMNSLAQSVSFTQLMSNQHHPLSAIFESAISWNEPTQPLYGEDTDADPILDESMNGRLMEGDVIMRCPSSTFDSQLSESGSVAPNRLLSTFAECFVLMSMFEVCAYVSSAFFWMKLIEKTTPAFGVKLGALMGPLAAVSGVLSAFAFDIDPPKSIVIFAACLAISQAVPHIALRQGTLYWWWIGGIMASVNTSLVYTVRFAYLRIRQPVHYGVWVGWQQLTNGVFILIITVLIPYNEKVMDIVLILVSPSIQLLGCLIVYLNLYLSKELPDTGHSFAISSLPSIDAVQTV